MGVKRKLDDLEKIAKIMPAGYVSDIRAAAVIEGDTYEINEEDERNIGLKWKDALLEIKEKRLAQARSEERRKEVVQKAAPREVQQAEARGQERVSIAQKAKNLASSLIEWVGNGARIVHKTEMERRLSICLKCYRWNPQGNGGLGECRHKGCGCTKAKHWLATSACPEQKWGFEEVRVVAASDAKQERLLRILWHTYTDHGNNVRFLFVDLGNMSEYMRHWCKMRGDYVLYDIKPAGTTRHHKWINKPACMRLAPGPFVWLDNDIEVCADMTPLFKAAKNGGFHCSVYKKHGSKKYPKCVCNTGVVVSSNNNQLLKKWTDECSLLTQGPDEQVLLDVTRKGASNEPPLSQAHKLMPREPIIDIPPGIHAMPFVKEYAGKSILKHHWGKPKWIALEKHPTTDLVVPLGNGSIWDNNELRFLLRSAEMYFVNLGKVYIVGEKPPWIKNVIHIPKEDELKKNKDGNIIAKVLEACRAKVTKQFVWCCDDTLFLKPTSTMNMTPMWLREYNENDTQFYEQSKWHKRLLDTMRRLMQYRPGMIPRYFQPHIPMLMDREKFIEMTNVFDTRGSTASIIATLYYNFVGEQGIKNSDDEHIFIGKNTDMTARSQRMAGYYNETLTPGFVEWLNSKYPNKSFFEE